MKLLVFLIAIVLILPVASQGQQVDSELDQVGAEVAAGDFDKAIAALNEIIKKHPDQARAYLLRSNLRMGTDIAGAFADINKAIQLKPAMGEAYYQRATLRYVSNDVAGALKDLDQSIASDFKTSVVYSFRGQLRYQQGDTKGALGDLDESIKINANDPRVYASRGAVLLSLNEFERAYTDLNYLLNWYETEPNKRLAATYPAPGDKELVPAIASSYLNRGVINSSRGNSDAAINDFTKSIRLDAKNGKAYSLRANELVATGDLEAALADVSRAIQLDPLNPTLRVEHGGILTLLGNTEDAQLDFDMVLKADPAVWQKRIDERIEALRKLAGSRQEQ
ncbi:MAG TPA: tetratricopeptide repeat protein [Pyrinomonadaceae bacterium]